MKLKPDLIASFFCIGVKNFKVTDDLTRFLKHFPVPGAALFNSPFDTPDNIWHDREASLEAVYEFNQKIFPHVNYLAVDQEGGRVRRLRGAYLHLPSAEKIIESEIPLNKLFELYKLAAEQMHLSGFRLNFAPVCDYRYPSAHEVIGDRSFGTNDEEVLPYVTHFCEAFEKSGVHTTLKHFPGHGPSSHDSHQKIAHIFKDKKDYLAEDLKIFESAAPKSSAIMTAHVAYQEEADRIIAMEADLLLPLKQKMPSHLAWFTDDIAVMKAVDGLAPWRKAFECEYDFILMVGSYDQAANAIEDLIKMLEDRNLTYAAFEEIEKRAARSRSFFKTTSTSLAFKNWRQQILTLEEKGKEILHAFKLN